MGIERPYAFVFLLLLIPIAVYSIYSFKRATSFLGKMYRETSFSAGNDFSKFKKAILWRTIFRLAACVMVIFAFAGISWGVKPVPLQKSGDAVSFVFDISYSMTATDCPDGLSRLEAASAYANGLLERMGGTEVSVVLAKGDGVIALPLTQDVSAVKSLLENLSPSLMTSAGSSIGKGIQAAIQSFPTNCSHNPHIWVFTDGDETDSNLVRALEDAGKFAFPVTLIGFGQPNPVEITAGDGKTKVKTSLRADKMIDAAAFVNQKKLSVQSGLINRPYITYLAADSDGSALTLLKEVSSKVSNVESTEFLPVSRHGIFLFFALLFFVLSYFAGEFDIHFFRNKKFTSLTMVFVLAGLLSSCRSGRGTVLRGIWDWHQKEYQKATGQFLRTYTDAKIEENLSLQQYAAFNLASTYIMQEEYEAALQRLNQIEGSDDAKLKSAACYNIGIIKNRQGHYDEASEYFKKAILLDNSNIDAKINLEFSVQLAQSRSAQSAETEMTATNIDNKDNTLSDQVFTLIQQEEREQWKKLQSNRRESSAIDY